MTDARPDIPQDVLERRATIRLLRYWLSLRRFGIVPAMSDFDPHRNPVPWENCFLIATGETPAELAIEHIGTTLWAALELPAPVSTRPADLPPLLRELVGDLDRVIDSGEPVERAEPDPHRLPSGDMLLYRTILLPFVDHRRRPRYVLGAVTMRLAAA
jgi:hypothetical protein